jgi:hypothetical protein
MCSIDGGRLDDLLLTVWPLDFNLINGSLAT